MIRAAQHKNRYRSSELVVLEKEGRVLASAGMRMTELLAKEG